MSEAVQSNDDAWLFANTPPVPASYEVVVGDNQSTEFDPARINLLDGPQHFDAPGYRLHGSYTDVNGEVLPIVSFLYHKTGEDGRYEQSFRLVIWRGMGEGVHPDHKGQARAWYLVGADIGRYDIGQKGDRRWEIVPAQTLGAKNFSDACVDKRYDIRSSLPVWANPPKFSWEE
jgi:hypothetical protein